MGRGRAWIVGEEVGRERGRLALCRTVGADLWGCVCGLARCADAYQGVRYCSSLVWDAEFGRPPAFAGARAR